MLETFIVIIIYPLTARVVGGTTDDFTSFFHFPCSPLPSGTLRTSGLSIPWCSVPTSSSVCLVFFPLSLYLARWFRPDLMNGRHDHTNCSLHLITMVRRSSSGLIACWILAWTSSLVTCQHGLCMRYCVVSCGSTSFPWLVFFFGALLWGSMIHKQACRKMDVTRERISRILDF